MNRLLVLVEGDTEEIFINEVVGPYLLESGYVLVRARILGKARQRARRGGIVGWPEALKAIRNHLREDAGCVLSTMVDYYGLPRENGGWPGRAAAPKLPLPERAASVEAAMVEEVGQAVGSSTRRFVPYVAMHEFEALLFSDCAGLAREIACPDLESDFDGIREAFPNPEAIDDDPEGAPSKRIGRLVDGYSKTIHGNLAALGIGIEAMRRECPHFADWIGRLKRAARR